MRSILTLCIAAVLGLAASTLTARTWHVPGDADSIAAGLDSAQVGDVVSVACGVYHEHDIVLKPGVELRSATEDSTCVTVDADSLGRVLICPSGTDLATVIGLTLMHGKADSTNSGGGVLCESGHLRLEKCRITECQAYDGGGLFCGDSSSVVLEKCHVSDNRAGGVSAMNSTLTLTECELFQNTDYGLASSGTTDTVTVARCAIMDNKGSGVNDSGTNGLHLLECRISHNEGPGVGIGDGWIEDCIISENGCGGVWGTDVRISGTSILGNFTPFMGGGAFLLSATSSLITNCTISGNTARIDGGGIFSSGPGGVDLTGSTVSGNSVLVGIDCEDTARVAVLPDNLAGGCAPKKWTILVYMNGDNNLEDVAMNDFRQLASVGSDDNVNIVVLFDRRESEDTSCGDWTSGKLFMVHKDQVPSASNQFWDMGETDMGDPGQLAVFVYQATGYYPAEHYALVIWDHGSAWTKKSKVLLGGGGGYRGASSDDESGNDISFAEGEFRQAFQLATQLLGRPLDIIAFDTCLNQMVECANEGLGYCDYWVGSEELAYGFRYDVFLKRLQDANGDLTPRALSRAIVEANDTHRRENTVSSLDMAMLPPLNVALDTLAVRLSDAMRQGYRYKILDAIDHSFLFEQCIDPPPDFYNRDLLSFTEQLVAQGMPAEVNDAVGDVQDALGHLVIANSRLNDHTECDYTALGGIAIHASAYYDTIYAGLQFAKQTHWSSFLIDLAGTTGVGPGPADGDSTEVASAGPLALRLQPSPFVSRVRMEYSVPRDASAKISVYDVSGRLVRELAVNGSAPSAGVMNWDGRDAVGQHVASGVYFIRLESGGRRIVRKTLLVR